jgi:GMP synthase (glutamine-hydrolysing)
VDIARRWIVVQHVAYEGPGAIAAAITGHGFGCEIVRIDRGDVVPPPQVAADLAGLVVMGGPMGVNEDAVFPWLEPERALLRAAVAHDLPVMGVCLGAQQLAAALGGTVTTGPAPEIGIGAVDLTAAGRHDPVLGPAGTPLACMHWHGDTFSLPGEAVLLASSEAYPHQAFRVGPRTYGLQFHVEVTAGLAGHWAPHLPPDVIVRAPDIARVARSGHGVVERFVALAGPSAH